MTKKLLLILVLSLVVLGLFSTVDEEINRIMKRTKAVGLAVAVVKDGEIVYTASLGKRDIAADIALENGDIFRIASISKSFSAVALMTLIEEGKTSLDADVSDLIGFTVRNPNFPDTPISLKMLLSHTSSLTDSHGYLNLDILNPQKNSQYQRSYGNYEPGTRYEYCNLGFNTIGAIIEKLSGVRFDQFIADKVTRPLSLNAHFNPDSLNTGNFVTLYKYKNVGTPEDVKMRFVASRGTYSSKGNKLSSGYTIGYSAPVFAPTGGMKTSAYDLAKYMNMLINYGKDPVSGLRVMSEGKAKLMQTPVARMNSNNDYCLGLRTSKTLIPGEVMIGHTGSAYGLFSAMFFEPEKKFGFVMMTNGCVTQYKGGFTVIQGDVIRALYDAFIRQDVEIPEEY